MAQEPGAVEDINRARVEDIEHKALNEPDAGEYDAPDDVLGPLMRNKIRQQQPPHERNSFLEFWAETTKADPDEDTKQTAKIVKNAIRRERRRERKGKTA